MHANNETGAIQPVDRGRRDHPGCRSGCARGCGIRPRARSTLPALVRRWSHLGHAVRRPRGVGALSVVKGCWLTPLIRGGSQRMVGEPARRTLRERWAWQLRRGQSGQGGHTSAPRATCVKRGRLLDGLRTIGGVELNATDPVVQETVSVRFEGNPRRRPWPTRWTCRHPSVHRVRLPRRRGRGLACTDGPGLRRR